MCRVTDAALSAICGLRKSGGHHHAVDLDERIAQMHINSESQQDSSGQLALAKPAPRYFGSKHQRRAPADDTTVELSRRKCHLQSLDAQFMTRCVNTLNLRVLNLSCNKLVKLPEAVTLLRNLEQLYVSNNQLVELPANISKLTNLKVLDVSSNRYVGAHDVRTCALLGQWFARRSTPETKTYPRAHRHAGMTVCRAIAPQMLTELAATCLVETAQCMDACPTLHPHKQAYDTRSHSLPNT